METTDLSDSPRKEFITQCSTLPENSYACHTTTHFIDPKWPVAIRHFVGSGIDNVL